ncbi:MAG: hypothetical protein KAT05_12775 [Spirochaetes bacterium]|nr:hypothetical protein [Spirochaetota bacterium]
MEDLLKKIKQTEEDANKIIDQAEIEAKKIVEKARIISLNKITDAKRNFFASFSQQKEKKLINGEKEREKQINEKINLFNNELGNIEQRKIKAQEFLKKTIKIKLGL